MAKGKKSKQLKLIVQALSSAEGSIALAKQLLSDYSGVEIPGASTQKVDASVKDLPGITGTFDGIFLVTKEGTKHQVAANYASKSRLVYGDTLRLVQTPGRDIFKQIVKVPRKTVGGVLDKKGEDWVVVTSDGSYQVLSAAVRYYEGEVGDAVSVLIPEDNPQAPFAAVDTFPGKEKEDHSAPPPSEEKPRSLQVREEKLVKEKPAAAPSPKKTPPPRVEKEEPVPVAKQITSPPPSVIQTKSDSVGQAPPSEAQAGTILLGEDELR